MSYQGFRGAGIRLKEEQVEHLQSHRTELLGDSLPAIHAFDKAHAVMLTEVGLLSREHGQAILRALRTMEERGVAETRIEVGGGMHSGEHYLVSELGTEIGGRVHIGRSSGDLIEVARRMTVRSHVMTLLDSLHRLRGALIELAAKHDLSVMPGYTHGQHAQPTTLGHWAAMMERSFARDCARLESLWQRLNLSPAGAAIMTGSDFALDRSRTCELLGFDAPLQNTMDAILSHDLEMEISAVYAVCGATLARIADDLFLWSTTEFAFVDIPDRFCGTSSIMPQKKNPDALEDVKSVAGRALAGVVSTVTAERGPTGFPILERRNTQDTLWAVGRDLGTKAGDLAEILSELTVFEDRMRRAAGSRWAQVTDVASAIVNATNLDWRTSHQVVGLFVRLNEEAGVTPENATLGSLDEAATQVTGRPSGLSPDSFADAMDAVAFVKRRTIYGGPSPEALAVYRGEAEAELTAGREWLAAKREQVAAAEAALERAIDALLS